MQDDARHEAAHATEQAEIGKESLLENAGNAHKPTTDTRGNANEDPHHQNAVLLMGAAMRATVVLVEEVYHEGCAYQGMPAQSHAHQSSFHIMRDINSATRTKTVG